MHPLVPTVLLGMPGFDALMTDSDSMPPQRQLRQTTESPRCEGRPVVRPDRVGDGEWVATRTAEREVALEIDCPDSVGVCCVTKWRRVWRRLLAPTPGLHQPVALQHCSEGALRW